MDCANKNTFPKIQKKGGGDGVQITLNRKFHFYNPLLALPFVSDRLCSNKEYFIYTVHYSVHHLYEDCHKGQFIIHKLSKKGSRSKLSSFLFKLIFLWGDCWDSGSKYCFYIKIKILIIDVQAKWLCQLDKITDGREWVIAYLSSISNIYSNI